MHYIEGSGCDIKNSKPINKGYSQLEIITKIIYLSIHPSIHPAYIEHFLRDWDIGHGQEKKRRLGSWPSGAYILEGLRPAGAKKQNKPTQTIKPREELRKLEWNA